MLLHKLYTNWVSLSLRKQTLGWKSDITVSMLIKLNINVQSSTCSISKLYFNALCLYRRKWLKREFRDWSRGLCLPTMSLLMGNYRFRRCSISFMPACIYREIGTNRILLYLCLCSYILESACLFLASCCLSGDWTPTPSPPVLYKLHTSFLCVLNQIYGWH